MSEQQHDDARGPRRLRVLPGTGGPTAAEPYADDFPVRPRVELVAADAAVPRVGPLDDLLRDVDALRSSLRQDLSLAATAIEAGEPALAGFLVDGASTRLTGFSGSAAGQLDRLDAEDRQDVEELPAASGSGVMRFARGLLPKAPFAAAAALVALIAGPAIPDRVHSGTTEAAAVSSYHELTRLAAEGASAEEVLEAAEELHERLAPLVAQAGDDPRAAHQALVLLEGERLVLMDGVRNDEVREVLREAQALVRKLRRALPRPPAAVPVPVPDDASKEQSGSQSGNKEQQKAKSSPKPSPKPSASPSPKPRPSEQPSAQPKPSPSETGGEEDPGPLPDPLQSS